MKRVIDKMGIDPNTTEGIVKLLELACNEIPDGKAGTCNIKGGCTSCIAQRLLTEVPTVKRWQTIESDEDIIQMAQEAQKQCREHSCRACPMKSPCDATGNFFSAYLLQEVEA